MSIIKANAWQKTDGTPINTVLQTIIVDPNYSALTTTVDATSPPNWSSWAVIMSATVTPKSSSSIFYATASTQVKSGVTSGTGVQLAICHNIGGTLDMMAPTTGRTTTTQGHCLFYSGTAFNNYWTPLQIQGYVQNSQTAAFTVSFRFANENTSAFAPIGGNDYGLSQLTIWEIAR